VQILNDARPWWGTLRGEPLTVADLVARSTLTPPAAATLGWTIQHGVSLFVAAGPPGAGKSTVANALLEFLPDDAQVYVTSGGRDRLQLPSTSGPRYLLINELSAHMPMYLYGPAASRAFELLRDGVRMIGTLHARSAAEAVHVMCYESESKPRDIACAFVFAVIEAHWQQGEIIRRVMEVGFLPPGGELVVLTRSTGDESALDPAGVQALADWVGLSALDVQAQIVERAAQLPM
jgi:type IV secretory pathway ATPase VirB11/archaellum biosynthesis ATPase